MLRWSCAQWSTHSSYTSHVQLTRHISSGMDWLTRSSCVACPFFWSQPSSDFGLWGLLKGSGICSYATDNSPAPRIPFRRGRCLELRSRIPYSTLEACAHTLTKLSRSAVIISNIYCNYFLVLYVIFIIKSYGTNGVHHFWTRTNWSSDFCASLYVFLKFFYGLFRKKIRLFKVSEH